MLGLGNTSNKGGGIAKVSKKGLQLWHKYDKSNAPYGEDIVENGKFKLDPDNVVDGGFDIETVSAMNTGRALSFDGIDSTVVFNDVSDIKTLAVWFSSDINERTLLGRTGSWNPQLLIKTNANAVSLRGIGQFNFQEVNTGVLYRLVITRDSNGLHKAYLNGDKSVDEITDTSPALNFNTIGAQNGSFSPLSGMVSDLQFYNKAWTQADVTYDYNNPNNLVTDDVDRPQLLGDEQVVNGGFDADISSWVDVNSSVPLWNSSLKCLETTASIYNGAVRQALTLNSGSVYEVSYSILGDTQGGGGNARVGVWETNSDASLISDSFYTRGLTESYSFKFTAKSTNQIRLYKGSNSGTTQFDNISVKEVTQHASHLTLDNLKGYWPLNEGSGSIAFDNSGEGNNGTINDATYVDTQPTIPQLGLMDWAKGSNLLKYSEEFDNIAWTKQAGTIVTPNSVTSPNGGLTADKVISNGANGIYSSISTSGVLARSVWLRSVSGAETVILKDPQQTITSVTCNLTETWQRFNLVEDNTLPSNAGLWVDDIPASGIYIWGAQIEQASSVGNYITTTASAVTDVTLIQDPNNPGFDILGNALTLKGDKNFNIPSGTVVLDSGWELGSEWDIKNGVISGYNTSSPIGVSLATSPKTYVVEYTVSNLTSGSVKFQLAGTTNQDGTDRDTEGTYKETITATSVNDLFRFSPTNFSGSIDNVSVQEMDNWFCHDYDEDHYIESTSEGVRFVAPTTAVIVALSSDTQFKAGEKYKISIDVAEGLSGSIKVDNGGFDSSILVNSAGVNEFIVTANNDGQHLAFYRATSNVDLTIKSIVVKEMSNSVHDYSNNENGGILYTGNALEFDGTGDYVNIDGFTLNGDVATFAFWANSNDTLGRVFDANPARFIISFNNNQLSIYDGVWHNFGSLTTGEYHRVVMTIDGTIARCFVGGVQLGDSKTITPIDLSHAVNVKIGAHYNGTSSFFNGKLSDLQIYNKAWTTSDVLYDWAHPEKDMFDDIDRAEVLSDNLVLNGDFNAGLDHWTLGHYGSHELINGKLKMISTSSSNIMSKNTSVSGKKGHTYMVTQEATDFTGGITGFIRLNGAYNPSNIISFTASNPNKTFVADRDFDYIQYFAGGANCSYTIDDVHLQEVTQHAASILPTDCKALYRLNEGYGDKVYNSAPVLSHEHIANGGFDEDSTTGWNVWGTGGIPRGTVEVVDNVLNVTNTSSSSTTGIAYLYFKDNQVSHSLTPGGTYNLKFKGRLLNGSGKWVVNHVGETITGKIDGLGLLTSEWKEFDLLFKAFDNRSAYMSLHNLSPGAVIQLDDMSLKQITPASVSTYTDGDTAGTTFVTAQRDIPQLGMCSYSKKAVLNGVNQSINTGSTIINTNVWSFNCWAMPTISDYPSVADNWELFNNEQLKVSGTVVRLRSPYGAIYIRTNQAGVYTSISSSGFIPRDKLSMITITYNNGSVNIYINGSLDKSGSLTNAITPTLDMHLGGRAQRFGGLIDENSVFNAELTLLEVQELYNLGTALDARDHSKSRYLTGYWRNNGTDTWEDLSTGVERLFLEEEYIANISPNHSVYPVVVESSNSISFDDTVLEEWGFEGPTQAGMYSTENTETNEVSPMSTQALAGDQVRISGCIVRNDGSGLPYEDTNNDGSVEFHFKPSEFVAVHIDKDSSSSNRVDSLGQFSVDYTLIADQAHFKISASNIAPHEIADTGVLVKDLSMKIISKATDTNGTVNYSPNTIILQEGVLFGKDSLGLPMNKVREKGLNLDGTGYVKVADDDSLDFGTGDFTMSCWVRYDFSSTGSSYNTALNLGGDLFSSANICTRNDGKLYFVVNGVEITSDSIQTNGAWVNVVGVRENGAIKMYVDTELQTSTRVSSATITNTLTKFIGKDSTSSRLYQNIVDEPLIHSRALTQKEITKNFKAGKSKHKNTVISNWSDDFTDDFI